MFILVKMSAGAGRGGEEGSRASPSTHLFCHMQERGCGFGFAQPRLGGQAEDAATETVPVQVAED